MPIVVAGATGKLGRLVVDALIERGVGPSAIVAAGRNADRLAEYAARGIRTAGIDFDDPDTLRSAFADAEKILLISANGNPRRVAQHQNAVDAAKAAGVALLAYTSFARVDISSLHPDHLATEVILRDSGVPHVVLRNPPYFEFRTREIPVWRESGRIVGAAGNGRLSPATRADLADAAAAALTGTGHEGATYELGGDAFTMAEFAAELSAQTGETIPYVDVSVDEFETYLVDAGIADAVATAFGRVESAIAAGEFLNDTGDLRRLRGRPSTTLSEAIALALRSPVDSPSLPRM